MDPNSGQHNSPPVASSPTSKSKRPTAVPPTAQEATTRGQIQSNIQAINSLRPAPAVLDSWSRPLGLSAASHSVDLQLQVSNPSQPPSLKFQLCSCRATTSSKPPRRRAQGAVAEHRAPPSSRATVRAALPPPSAESSLVN
jgi:hypothetical protein